MTPHDDRMDRYVRGELTVEESRELAQQSLDSPELLEDLTYVALAKSGLNARSVPPGNVLPFRRKLRWIAVVASAAAAAALVWISLPRDSFRTLPPPNRLVPALSLQARPGQPRLLAAGLRREPSRGGEIFRGAEPAGRQPRPSGRITALEGGTVSIDLGTLDGVAKGSELPVFHDDASVQPVARLIVTTVFRERARGSLVSQAQVRVSDRVQVPRTLQVEALLEQVAALSAQGDSDAARKIAEQAANLTESDVPASQRRKVYERLAALEFDAGLLQAAESHYRSAAEDPAARNNLAVLYALRGDYQSAETTLRQAPATSPAASDIHGSIANNLGVLAELRGDRQAAEMHYSEALSDFAPAAEQRGAIEANLARIRGSR